MFFPASEAKRSSDLRVSRHNQCSPKTQFLGCFARGRVVFNRVRAAPLPYPGLTKRILKAAWHVGEIVRINPGSDTGSGVKRVSFRSVIKRAMWCMCESHRRKRGLCPRCIRANARSLASGRGGRGRGLYKASHSAFKGTYSRIGRVYQIACCRKNVTLITRCRGLQP